MKTFIFFLGTNDYKECLYEFTKEESHQTCYTQLAILKKHKNDIGKIIVFLTEDARKKNWEGVGKLKEQIKSITSINPVEVDIPNGFNNEDLLGIFTRITNSIDENAELIIDVTHSFRSLPITLSSVLNYLKSTKNCKIYKIYYGAFEVLGNPRDVDNKPIEERIAPMLDITYLDTIQEWAKAVDNLLKFGNANLLNELSQNAIKPILIETQGKDENASTIRKIVKDLVHLTENLYTCRSKELLAFNFDEFNKLLNSIIQNDKLLPQVITPLKKIQEKTKTFNNQNKTKNLILLVEWCLDFNWIQQAYTLLQESIISFILEKLNQNYINEDTRNSLSSAITIYHRNIQESEWKGDKNQIKTFLNNSENNEQIKHLINVYVNLSDCRNDINHAGYRQNSRNPDALKNEIRNYFNQVTKLI